MPTTTSYPKIKEASPRKRSMMISKCQKVWAWLNSLRETPLGDHDKITIDHRLDMHLVSDEDHVSPWRFINLNWKGHMPQYEIKCMVDQKIRQHWIIRHQMCNLNHPYPQLNLVQQIKEAYPRRRSMMTSKCWKVWVWLNGSRKAPLGDHDKITNRSSSRRVSCKWGWSCKSMEIYKSQQKWKYALVWHHMYGRSKNRTTSNYPSSNTWSQSSKSTAKSHPYIKRRLSKEEAWGLPNIKSVGLTEWPKRGSTRGSW